MFDLWVTEKKSIFSPPPINMKRIRDNIYMLSSSSNILRSNNVRGIDMYLSNNNILTNNNASNSYEGIRVTFSNNNNITNNTVKSNTDIGIWLGYSSNNTLKNNIISENNYNFGVKGDRPSEYVHNIDTSNRVNGKPIYYLVNRQDQQIPDDAGFVGIVNSTNITVRDLTLPNNYEGVLFANTKNSWIENVTVSNSRYGIHLSYSSNNLIKNNTANSNSWHGIHLSYSSNNTVTNNTVNSKNATYSQGISLHFSSNNAIYLNNFLNNNQNAYSENSTNFWNSTGPLTYTYYGIERTNYLGNYWDDYTGSDPNHDGIGDSPYNSIDGDKDNYPLMWHWENYFAPPEKQPPIALFTYAPTYPVVNQPITFDASVSYDPEGFITNYEWDFGDGNITNTTEKIITHSYALAGDYNVNLTVTDNDGVMNSTSKVVRVLKSTLHEDEWNQTFGGTDRDWAWAVQQTADGGYILAGETYSYGAGESDFWLVKTDSNGTEQWNQTFGGTDRDEAHSVQQTEDGGYILAGSTWSYGAGFYDVLLVKTDANGTEQWNQTFGGTSGDIAKSVQQTSDGGYILAGRTYSFGEGSADLWLVKTDYNGNEQWNQTLGGADHDYGEAVQQTGDGGYILAGTTGSYGVGRSNFWLLKTDSNGNEQWNKTFGAGQENAYSIQRTSDGGYILAGSTGSYGAGSMDFWLVKTDSDGNKQWSKTFGGTSIEEARSVRQTADGGYILAGKTGSYGPGSINLWLVKIDSAGNKQWDKTFGAGNDAAYSVQQTADEGFIVAGLTHSYGAGSGDFRLIKVKKEGPTPAAFFTYTPKFPGVNQPITFDASVSYDPDGNITNYEWDFGDGNTTNTTNKIITHSYALKGDYTVNLTVTDNDGLTNSTSKRVTVLKLSPPEEEWNKTFGGAGSEGAYSLQLTSDGGFILAGGTSSYGAGSRDFWLIKVDSSGTEEWNRTFGGTEWDGAYSVQQTTDGGYILTGETKSYGAGAADAWLIKTDSSGIEQWNQTFGGAKWDYPNAVLQTSDNGYIFAGETSSYGAGAYDFWLVKTDANGNEQWNQTFGGNDQDFAKALQKTTDGGYILAGETHSYGAGAADFWLVKTDSNGNEEWNQTFGGTSRERAWSIRQTSDGGYIIAGYTQSYGAGEDDFWMVKTDARGNEQWNQTFGGADYDFANTNHQTSDGCYIIAGRTRSYGASNYDFWMVKTDSSGDKEWYQIFGGPSMDEARAVQQLVDNSYIIAGYTNSYGAGSSDVWLIKLKGEQTILIFDTEPSKNPYPSIMRTHNGTITSSHNINVSTLYTYACAGTCGHTESLSKYKGSNTPF